MDFATYRILGVGSPEQAKFKNRCEDVFIYRVAPFSRENIVAIRLTTGSKSKRDRWHAALTHERC
jgi:hypothetical protein